MKICVPFRNYGTFQFTVIENTNMVAAPAYEVDGNNSSATH
jgi:hypothetical protein